MVIKKYIYSVYLILCFLHTCFCTKHPATWRRGKMTAFHLVWTGKLQIQPGIWNQICQPEHILCYTGMAGSMNSALVKGICLQPQIELF